MNDVLEIEVDSPKNRNLYFVPLDRNLRGRFDYMRTTTNYVKKGAPVYPGQVLGVNLSTGETYIKEPIHDSPELKREVEKRFKLAPAREDAGKQHVPTILYWMKRAIESGSARIVNGRLPEKIDGEPKKRFNVPDAAPNPMQEAVSQLVQMNQALLALLPDSVRNKLGKATA